MKNMQCNGLERQLSFDFYHRIICTKCENKLIETQGKYGIYHVCSNDKCKKTSVKFKQKSSKKHLIVADCCPSCESSMVSIDGKYGVFFLCLSDICKKTVSIQKFLLLNRNK